MAIEEKTNEYKTHKHKFNVYVNLNTKTKLGQDLLEQYHQQSKRHYMDIGRIGYHDEYGRYILDDYTRKELMIVPKIIIKMTKKAVDRVGKDVYQLRTYMSRFGQLNFLLLIDKDKAELVLVENVYIENVNHKEDYETLIWRLTYHNQKPVPLAEIFYKFGIKANPDDYAQAWSESDIKINNLIVGVAKAEFTKQLANKFASDVNQKTLLASLNYLNKEGEYGKKITKAYSEKIAHKKEINELATNKKLENTLNHVLIKTLEDKTTKKDVKNKENFGVYKKVLDLQMTSSQHLADKVAIYNTQETLKKFLEATYQNSKAFNAPKKDNLIEEYSKKQKDFEKAIDYSFKKKIDKEKTEVKEEKIVLTNIKHKKLDVANFTNFEGQKIEIDANTDRFYLVEDKEKKKKREKEESLQKKLKKKSEKIKAKTKKNVKQFNAICSLDEELEKSKTIVGLEPKKFKKKEKIVEFFDKKSKSKIKNKGSVEEKNVSKLKDNAEVKINKKTKEKNKTKNVFVVKEKSKNSKKNKELLSQPESESLIKKIEKKIKNNNIKKEQKVAKKQNKIDIKKQKQEKKTLEREKKKLLKEYNYRESKTKKEKTLLLPKKEKKKKKTNTAFLSDRGTDKQKDKKQKANILKAKIFENKTKTKTNNAKEQVVKSSLDKSSKIKVENDLGKENTIKGFYHAKEQTTKVFDNSMLKVENVQAKNVIYNNPEEEEKKKKNASYDTTQDVKNMSKEQEQKFVKESIEDLNKFNKTHFDISTNKRVVKKNSERSMEM